MFFSFNQEQSTEALESQLTNHLQRDEVYYCSEIKHGFRLVIVPCPKAVQRKEDISRWLRWWTGFLELWGLGKLMSLYSLSEKYDPIVKMVSSESGLNRYLTNPNARATARLKNYEIETRKMTQFKEKLRAIQDDDKESLLEECSEYGRSEQRKDHRADSEIPTYDLTKETESEGEGDESEQEQDQRGAEPSQKPTITRYITRPKDDICQRIAQTRQELQETARQGALLSAALERHKGNLQRMANTPSHREHDPTQSKVRPYLPI
ncbi:hypothetical protein AMECASPLE_030659 [Ameca splendens]|uniref:Uncharacterized protein n=1 Tax=Ameca splendens TaxID=208324 RepID=A0ABV1A286_9TELE